MIFLPADGPLAAAPSTQLGRSTLAVHLCDDLAGRARMGDRVLTTGSCRFYGGTSGLMAPGTQLPLTQGFLVSAVSPEAQGSWRRQGSLSVGADAEPADGAILPMKSYPPAYCDYLVV